MVRRNEPEHPDLLDQQDIPDVDPEVIGGPLVRIKPIADAMEQFRKMSSLVPLLRADAIKNTLPQDWVQMGDGVYLQGSGSERIMALGGIVLGHPTIDREDLPDRTYIYVVEGPVMSRVTGVALTGIQGGRWSGEDFFARYSAPKPKYDDWKQMNGEQQAAWKQAHLMDPNPMDVRKAAVTNWQNRCVSIVMGLRGLTPEDLAKHGLTPKRNVQFKGGTQGGAAKATDAAGNVLWPIGPKKGTPIKDLADKEISGGMAWFQSKREEHVKNNKTNDVAWCDRWIEECEKEIERRAREAGGEAPAEASSEKGAKK